MIYENYPVGEMASEGLGGKGLGSLRVHGSEAVERTNYDLNVLIGPVGEGIEIEIRYNGKVYEGKGIERVVDHLERVIGGFIAGTEKRVTEIGYLSGEERGQLLEAFNDTEAAYPADKTIVELFGEQVERKPDRVAVVDEGEEISYRELDERSNQLGHYLRERGVREETLVPICIDRSVEMMVGATGDTEGGGCVCADRSGVSGGADPVYGGRCRGRDRGNDGGIPGFVQGSGRKRCCWMGRRSGSVACRRGG